MKKLFEVIENYLRKKTEKLGKEKIDFTAESKVEMDSRKIQKGDIFFAINSGNEYIEEVLKKNPALIFTDKPNEHIKDDRIVIVDDSVKTMQEIAHDYAKAMKTQIIGITGSNGKTTSKDILYSILSEKYKVEKTKGNYNNHIGLPYTILSADEELDFLILEMGMSDLGEIDLLCKIAEPEYGVITNIGFSHMETLKTQENVFKAKTEMAEHVAPDKLFVSGEDEYLKRIAAVKVGYEKGMDYLLENFIEKNDGIEFCMEHENEKEAYSSSLNGRYNSLNLGIAIALAKKIGLSYSEIQKGIDKISLTPMRFQKIIWNGLEIINDAYNASPLSMEAGLETFVSVYKTRRKIAVLGDMLELGDREIFYHEEVIKKSLELEIENIMLFGPRMKKALQALEAQGKKDLSLNKIQYFTSKDEIGEELKKIEFRDAAVFLKGSRGMRLEEILK